MPSSENPRVGVDIGPEVLNFARHQEDGGHQEVQLGVLECKHSLPGIVRILLLVIVIVYEDLFVSGASSPMKIKTATSCIVNPK